MNKTDSKEKNQFKFVYQSGQRLNQVHNQKNSYFLSRLRKKWARAAIVALASSTVLLFSTHNVKADVQKPNDDQQPDPVTQKTGEQAGQTLQAVQRKEDAVPADLQKQAQSDEVALNNAARQADKTVVAENKNTAAVTTQESNSTVANQSTDAKKNTNVQQTQQQAQTKVATNDTTTVANQQAKNQNNTGDKNSNTQSPVKNPVDDGQTKDQAGQKDANGVELPANNQDHVKGDVQSAWNQGYKGEHIVIAVIDSGVDVNHKDFLTMPKDPKLTATQMKRLIKKLGYGRYVNEKFPFVYNYVDNEDDHMKAPDSEPHGQHVSGIIAADGHPDGDKEYVVGVAPEAQLMQLKVFGDNSTSLDTAKEIYDAVNLGADVITMSLGGGVSAADLNIQDQRAVQYAVDHGVVVTIAASNNGNSASVDDPTNLTDLSNYESGGNAGNYDPFSSSTVADPGAARSAITVAAETSGTGKNSDMAFFSSWGPLPDYTLKPDIAAPGYDIISTANDNGYTEMSGTSMATPFVAGSAALVKERLAKTNPRLRGAALVEAIKALLMNTAHPQVQNRYTALVSPRRQGAGQIDVGAATASPVYITTPDGTGALSLRQVGNSTNFVLTLHNLSIQTQEYNFDDYGGGYTEVRNKANGIFHDVQLAGARVNGANTIILKPNETKKVTYTLNLTNLKANQLVEGYLRFTNTKDKSTLVVPYLSYYGDMTKENVFDQNANDPHPDIQGNRLVNEDNYPLGIADEDSLKELVNVDGNYNWQEVAKLYESGKVAFSPNGDHKSDLIKPYAYLKQNIKDLKVEILDGSGKVVRVLTDSRGVEKSYHSDGDGATVDLGYGATNPDTFDWDGKLYDVKTGKMVTAPDGNYTYRFIATLYNNGPEKVQTNDTPVIIDTTAPVLENVHYNRRTPTISGNYSDKGAGFTDYSYATITINDQVFGFKLDDGKNSAFDDAAKTKGHFSFKLNKDQLAALTSADNLVSVAFSDVADNTAVKTLKLDGTFDEPGVSIWNATNGLPFNENSADYNKQNNTFTLRGSASDDFYLNGKWVQVDNNGQFVVPVDALGEQNLVFSLDDAGKDVLTTFRNSTLKAKFAWQHVDGQEKHFGPAIYSIFGSDPNDIVVQAAVTKGNNVKAFAKDYFTSTVYTGVVKDGIATFHVKTSINQDPNTKIYANALLQGWTEIDGPTYNEKQVTDPTSINDANYIGIYYDRNAKTKTYTNRDDLGVTMTDEAADPSDFGPGYYPGYSAPSAHNPDIKFDYLDDNNEANVGADAIQKGYYNPRTHLFTLTGQVDDKVISLTFLAASPYEEATDNQADISNDGKFSVSFKISPTETRELSYLYMTNDGKITRGSLTIVLDTVLPTLKVDQVPAGQNEVEITTSNPDFVLSGVANDNLDSYAVTIDGDNVFTQFGNSGYDFIPGLYPKGQKTPNTYGPYKFKVNEALDDENGKPTTHVYTVDVVDGVGNKVEKKIVVYYDPSYKPAQTSKSEDNKQATPTQPAKPIAKGNNDQTGRTNNQGQLPENKNNQTQTAVPVQTVTNTDPVLPAQNGEATAASNNGNQAAVVNNNSEGQGTVVNKSTNEAVAAPVKAQKVPAVKRIKLYRNTYAYQLNGKLVRKLDKKVLYKKGQVFTLKNKGKVVKIKGQAYYQVGKNTYIKVSATLKGRQLKRLINVYDKNGKKKGQIKAGQKVKLLNNGKITVIHGQKFYQIGKNSFVKVADFR